MSESEVLKFLFEKGLPQTTDKTKVKFIKSERNMKVSIEDSLGWKSVHTLLQNIHFHECNEKFWNVPLYCKPIRTLTPVKQNPNAGPSKDDDIDDKVSNTVPNASQSDSYVNDYVFSDVTVKTPTSDKDSQKRKTVSPVEQEKTRKTKNFKVNK